MISPYVKVLAVPDDISDETIIEALTKSTSTGKNANLKSLPIRKIYQSENVKTKSRSIVFQLHSKQWKTAIANGYLNVSWSRLRVVNSVPVQRCYRCQAFGHTAKHCGPKKIPCSYCAGEHDMKTCTSNNPTGKCTNCVKHNKDFHTSFPTDHPASSHQCNVYKFYKSKQERQIKYIHA